MRCKYCGKELEQKQIMGRTIYLYKCGCLEKEQKRVEINSIISKADFPAEILDIIFDRHPLKKFSKEILLNSSKKYIAQINKFVRSKVGLFLIGVPGVGKTLSLVYLVIEIIKRYQKPVKFATAEDITNCWNSFDYELKNKYERYKKVPILIIDDVSPQKWNMYDIINYRTSNYKLTFLSSNYGFQEISQYFGVAVMSRIKSKFIIDNIKDTVDRRKLVVG